MDTSTPLTFGEVVWQYVMPTLATAVSALITWGLRHVIALLKAKSHDARFHCAMDKVETVTVDAVMNAEQTVVGDLRKGGKVDSETGKKALAAALETARSNLGPRGIAELRDCLGLDPPAIDRLLSTRIEREVLRRKDARASSSLAVPSQTA